MQKKICFECFLHDENTMNPMDKSIKNTLKQVLKMSSVTLVINIFICISQILNILDNEIIVDLINGEFEWKTSTPISICAVGFDVIIFIASNVIYNLVMNMRTKIERSIYFDDDDTGYEIKT